MQHNLKSVKGSLWTRVGIKEEIVWYESLQEAKSSVNSLVICILEILMSSTHQQQQTYGCNDSQHYMRVLVWTCWLTHTQSWNKISFCSAMHIYLLLYRTASLVQAPHFPATIALTGFICAIEASITFIVVIVGHFKSDKVYQNYSRLAKITLATLSVTLFEHYLFRYWNIPVDFWTVTLVDPLMMTMMMIK